MKMQKLLRLSALLLCGASLSAAAMDIDLFMTDNKADTNPANIMFMLDTSANFSAVLYKSGGTSISKLDVMSEALYQVLTDPVNRDAINVGLTFFTSKTGGKVMAAVKPLTASYQSVLGSKIYNAVPWTANTSLVRPVSGHTTTPIYVLPNYSSDNAVAANHWTGHYYSVTADGTTGATEPTWPTDGSSVTSGTVTFKDMGSVYGATAIQAIYPQKANGASYALSMYEDYLYFRGDTPLNGKVDGNQDPDAISLSTGNYVSPNANQTCEKNFIVVIGNGAPDSGENNSSYSNLKNLYTTYGLTSNPQVITLTPNYSASCWADEYSALFGVYADSNKVEPGKQPINTYVVGLFDPTVEFAKLPPPDQGAIVFLKSIAEQGKGRYFEAGNTAQFSAAMRIIIDEVKAVNSVFASTTLPVSINVRGTNLNQVYMGVFRPDANKYVDWYGNLKMYKLGYDAGTGAIYLADALGKRADSAVTGFIVSSAASFWTHRTDSSIYAVSGSGETQWWWWRPEGDGKDSDYVDGELVEKGAAGQWLREHPGERKLYTCHTCASGTELQTFDATHVTASDLGVATSDTAAAVVDFIKGNNAVADGQEKVRSMVHGDVLHSRPATINYGPSSDDVVVYYGANDGVFHAVKGGESASSWGHRVGEELWGFIPPELFTSLPKLYSNPTISGSNPKPFFVDGTIASLNWDQKNYVFLTMRRGARAIYALNVADNDNAAPTVAWHLNQSDLPELGQTWSDPNVYLANINGTVTPVIVMGAGYDTAEDLDQTAGTSDTMGRGIYVLNAVDGTVIKFLGNTAAESGIYAAIVDSIPGGIKSAGSIDKGTGIQLLTTAYAADTGGNVWRLGLSDPDPNNWTMTKMAALGGTDANNRKFLYQPDVVNRPTYGYTAVLVGSGDREHPLDTTVQNYFFLIKDYADVTKNSWPLHLSDLPDVSVTGAYTGTQPGWRRPFTGSGEKDVGTSITISGVVYFNTNVPFGVTWEGNTCSPSLGEARSYAVGLDGSCQAGGGQCYTVAAGGGFLPSPVPFTVDIDGKTVAGIISGPHVVKPKQPPFNSVTHEYRYKDKLD